MFSIVPSARQEFTPDHHMCTSLRNWTPNRSPTHYSPPPINNLRHRRSPLIEKPAANTLLQPKQTPSVCTAATPINHDDIEPIPPAMLPALQSLDDLEQESAWLGGMLALWLDEEWTPLPVHEEVGQATARLYTSIRQIGMEDEVGDVVLGLAQGLLSFNFRETFVSAFDVANKSVEFLMIKRSPGCDVCCVSERDREAIERWDAAVQSRMKERR